MYSLSSLFLLAQAAPVRTPLWVVIVAPIAAALATLAATWITLSRTNLRERERLDQEERMQGEKLKHESQEAWRVERKQAYTAFLASARSARGALDQDTSDDSKGALLKDLREAHAAVTLVVETNPLRSDAEDYYQVCKRILRERDRSELKSHVDGYADARNDFLRSARAELGFADLGSTQENKAIVRRLYEEAITQNKPEVFDEIMSADIIDHTPFPEQPPGLEGFKGVFTMVLSAFPDYQSTVEDQIAKGDKVVTRFCSQGTHQGEFMGIAPTGNRVRMTGIDIDRLVEGKIVEHWSGADLLGMITQLGVISEPGQSEEAAPP